MKFRVCFTLTKYEKDMLLVCETTNVFVDAFLLFQIPFSSVRMIYIDLNNVEIFKCL